MQKWRVAKGTPDGRRPRELERQRGRQGAKRPIGRREPARASTSKIPDPPQRPKPPAHHRNPVGRSLPSRGLHTSVSVCEGEPPRYRLEQMRDRPRLAVEDADKSLI